MTLPGRLAVTKAREVTVLERAVVEAIAYSDVFDFPLTAQEVWRALPVAATLAEVEGVLRSDRLVPCLLVSSPPYYALAGREDTIAVREQRRATSQRLLAKARFYGSIIGRLPFVRLVAVTGSLAVENAEPTDDLDYLIVTAPGRVWLTRALVIAVVRLARLRGDTVCPNYLLSESALALSTRDVYTARELVQMLPVAGGAVYERMLVANAWRREFLPNAQPRGLTLPRPEGRGIGGAAHAPAFRPGYRSTLRRMTESLLWGCLGDTLERLIFERKARELRAQSNGDEAVFDETMCKGHFDGHRQRTRAALSERLQRLGIAP